MNERIVNGIEEERRGGKEEEKERIGRGKKVRVCIPYRNGMRWERKERRREEKEKGGEDWE